MIWEGQEVVFNDINELAEMSWEEYLDYMYGKIQDDETLLVGIMDEDPFDESYGRVHIYKCGMEWYDGTLQRMKESIRKIMDELHTLAEHWKSLNEKEKSWEVRLKDVDSYEAWKKYLKPLPDVERFDLAAQARVGHGINAYGVMYRARRLCELYEHDAAPVMVACEERSLAQAYAIHKCCNSMEQLGKVETEQDEDPAK